MTNADRPPSVERLLTALRRRDGLDRASDQGTSDTGASDPRESDAILAIARAVIEDERSRLADGRPPRTIQGLADAAAEARERFADPLRSGLTPVLNATGVILHTNLGRAPWPDVAVAAATRAAAGYSLLEFDRAAGRRGPRFRAVEDHLIALTGAEDALVTVNNAAALVLAVRLAGRGGVAVSRGELVEIGGSVRIPEIVRRAGARLIEVGTTNRTRSADFEAPLAEGRATVVLRVHPSNFSQAGFVESPDPVSLARLAHDRGAILVDDVGSGALLDTSLFGLAHEPMPRDRIAAGADLVTFSGDKLVGGPQAGLIVGRADLIARIRRDPLARAVRPDKVTLAAVAATLGLYRAGRATTDIPVWRMIADTRESLEVRADTLLAGLPGHAREVVSVSPMQSTVGGGSLPGQVLESVGLVVRGRNPTALSARLRAEDRPVIGRVESEAVWLDLRTVDGRDDAVLAGALIQALSKR